MKFRQASLIGTLFVSIFGSHAAFATNGYFSHGYGVKSQGIAGIGIALPQDGLAAATNPAGTALVGNRLDLGLSWFAPKRGAEIQGGGLAGSYEGNNTRNFFIPEVGYARQLSSKAAVGLAIYGNGGMNTDYGTNAFGSAGQGAGVDLSQLFISPSFAWKLGDKSAIGVAPVFAYQQFAAKGLGAYSGYSVSPGNLTDNGHDSSSGWGVRLGWTGEVVKDVTLGLTWASKIKTGKFEKYQGLFADGGSFDIPENYGAGLAWKVTPALTLAADYQRILYGEVNSIANPLSNLFAGNALGSANGPGFGWRNINVVKLGASYDYSDKLTLRAGVSHATQPIPGDQTYFNILAPGVVQDHLTLGASWNTGSGELSVSYAHGFRKTVTGAAGSVPPPAGGSADIHLEENILGIAYGWKL